MDKPKLVVLKRKPRINLSAVGVLEDLLAKVKSGEILRVGCIYKYRDDDPEKRQWGSSFSSTNGSVEDAAMLVELGLRRMGFKQAEDG